jgi:MFS family permease
VGLSSLFIGNAFQAQMPEFASAFATAQGELLYTALLTANAAGAVFGGVALESFRLFRRPRAHLTVLLAALWSLAIGAFAVAPTYGIALLALFAAGVLNLAFNAMAQTLVQLEAPAAVRGRVLGLFNMSQLGLRVGSGVTVGVLGSFIGVHASLGLSALAFVAASLALLLLAGSRGAARPRERTA